MINTNILNKAFRNYDLSSIKIYLDGEGLRDVSFADKFMSTLRQSSCLVIKIKNGKLEQLRDKFVAECRGIIDSYGLNEIKPNFEEHVENSKLAELGYREIFSSLHSSRIWNREPAEQAWGIIRRLEKEILFAVEKAEIGLTKLAEDRDSVFDPQQFRIAGEDGGIVRPDALMSELAVCTGDALITLAYAHKWFDDSSREIVIPTEVVVDDSIAIEAGNFYLAASQWSRLEKAWDRSRLFNVGLRMREQECQVNDGSTRTCRVLEGASAGRIELIDRIAMQRMEQVFFQRQIHYSRAEKDSYNGIYNSIGQTEISISEPLSLSEYVAIDVLKNNFHLPVGDDSVVVGGLSLRVWIRGYAYYEKLAQGSDGNRVLSCLRMSESDLIDGMTTVGLTREQAILFIKLTSFGGATKDIFDAPLLRVSDGTYCFFSVAYHSPVIGMIVISRIAALNRRRDEQGDVSNDCTFDGKGKAFENYVISLFLGAGVPAHGFRYKLMESEYDCDVAVLIDDTMYVFECKNRSLPMGHISSIYYFSLALKKAQGQVKRIAQQLNDNPDILREHFGKEATWNRIVPVVLHALPWNSYLSEEVYTYDGSALSILMNDGVIRLVIESRVGIHTVLRRHGYQLRQHDNPTPEELEREMRNPCQIRLHEIGWTQISKPIQISDDMVFAFPEWIQQEVTLQEKMIALGSTPEEADKLVKGMLEDSSTVTREIDGILKDRDWKE